MPENRRSELVGKLSESRQYNGGPRVRAFGEVLRNRIDSTLALEVLHAAMSGQDVTRTQLEACRIALGKVLPDLQAVAIAIEDNRPATKADIDSLLLQSKLNPALIWSSILDRTSEPVATIASGGAVQPEQTDAIADSE